ncbi:hypothetical protein IAQ61_011802 [Plenodomus lingam]|uniref:Ubiquitin-like domain-containing protein n=1 Tax=Leptosphaeria maculans (strain JN3 / isolate v23.1.3 / race Av1-4-5-6-7-8) TaxID=985895 RepID=E5AB56_LEPMJ|nr:hypothetical protein LEMA_P020270.1 [Plenodomus lingam JN3]KAH9860018.1 hypothetical protein IAQ61_011802 [Plenodomus lingam]CBY00897.1 hypothetical protein LEMA_P020270.1 [Plenodomus lingam JN3]
MSEIMFCKSFLSALDARPAKLSSDHIADARQYPAQGAYILPRLPHPPHPQRPKRKATDLSSDNSTTLSITLKPMKPSTPTIPLSNIEPSKTSIFDLKQQYATQSSIPAAKIKILYKKKPVMDSKTVAEVVGADAAGEVEFGVMVMGGGVASPAVGGTPVQSPPAVAPSEADKGLAGDVAAAAASTSSGPVAAGPSGKELVATDEFWSDLNNFVLQRIKDEVESERLLGLFKKTWEQNK